MIDARKLKLAKDPNLVPGIYNTCDQWCEYCPATARCFSFRARQGRTGLEAGLIAAMGSLRDCYEAEGLEMPEEMRLLIAGQFDRARQRKADPIEQMANQYLRTAAALIASIAPEHRHGLFDRRADGPTPLEIFVFYHWTIGVKAARAVASAGEADRTGSAAARRDAECSAKVALLAIDRSDEAMQVIALDDPDPRLEIVRRLAVRLRRELERRFPAARSVVRPGLDDVAR
jgi:hypothetical protein